MAYPKDSFIGKVGVIKKGIFRLVFKYGFIPHVLLAGILIPYRKSAIRGTALLLV
ncbi:MAG: hypothetical protein ACFB0B_06750 [Thermonemataceae bacterium]